MMLSIQEINKVEQDQLVLKEKLESSWYTLGVYDGDTLIAYGTVNLDGDCATICSATLKEEYRTRGYKQPLYKLLEAECRNKQIRSISYLEQD